LKVLEKLGGYDAKLTVPDTDSTADDADADEVRQRLVAEYYVLRTALVRIYLRFESIVLDLTCFLGMAPR
jgi:hypothetical protein